MRRRQFVAVLSALVAPLSLAGCLDSMAGTRGIAYENLSPAAQKEIREAYREGEYTQCGELAVMDEFETPSGTVVRYEGESWKLVVAVGDHGPNADCPSTYSLELTPA